MSADEKVDAWMPFWIGAYLADTMNLTRDQHGGYFLLLLAYWRNKGPLPDDDQDLATITKASLKEWKPLRLKLAKFFQVGDGLWSHKRADEELRNAGIRKAAAVQKAKAGAEARWSKPKIPDAPSDAPTDASSTAPSMPEAVLEDMPKQCPTPSPITSSLRSEVKTARKRADPPPVASQPDDVDEQVWKDWTGHRLPKKWACSETVLNSARKEAGKVPLSLNDFLIIWCNRGTQGLQAEWLKPEERRGSSGETDWQRSARENVTRFAPLVARKAPGKQDTPDLEIFDVPSIASN